ncbi:MAG: FAD-binding oxidoreductase [Candidatus Binatia bacterium]
MDIGAFRDLLPANAIATGDTAHAFTVDDLTPQYVLFPETVDQLSRCIAAVDQAGLAMMPVGSGTRLGIGNLPQRYDIAVSTRRLNRILAHEAADMTVTVEAGATLAELNAALLSARQRLPVDPPDPEHASIGALIATDASGPLRLSQGKVRDLLIGIKVVLADGTLVKGGGRVVKNVAGYDLMKLFTGSFGTLGTVVEATFKVRPCPEHEALFVVPAAEIGTAVAGALDILAALLAPLYVEAFNPVAAAAIGENAGAMILVGCGGNSDEITAQRARLEERAGKHAMRTYDGTESARRYAALRDFPSSVPRPLGEGRGEGMGAKLSLLPSQLAQVLPHIEDEAARNNLGCAILSHVGSGVAYVRLNGTDDVSLIGCAEWIRATVRQADGWAVFDGVPTRLKSRVDTWGADIPATSLMRGIKQALDPRRRLSPGRFVGGI